MLEIDINVGRLVTLSGDEALEQQIATRRIDFGNAEAIADGGIRRGSPPLAENPL